MNGGTTAILNTFTAFVNPTFIFNYCYFMELVFTKILFSTYKGTMLAHNVSAVIIVDCLLEDHWRLWVEHWSIASLRVHVS